MGEVRCWSVWVTDPVGHGRKRPEDRPGQEVLGIVGAIHLTTGRAANRPRSVLPAARCSAGPASRLGPPDACPVKGVRSCDTRYAAWPGPGMRRGLAQGFARWRPEPFHDHEQADHAIGRHPAHRRIRHPPGSDRPGWDAFSNLTEPPSSTTTGRHTKLRASADLPLRRDRFFFQLGNLLRTQRHGEERVDSRPPPSWRTGWCAPA